MIDAFGWLSAYRISRPFYFSGGRARTCSRFFLWKALGAMLFRKFFGSFEDESLLIVIYNRVWRVARGREICWAKGFEGIVWALVLDK